MMWQETQTGSLLRWTIFQKTKEEIEEAVDKIDVGFEIAALVASTEAVDDVQLPMGYFMESGGVAFEDIVDEDIIDEEELDGSSVQGDGEEDLVSDLDLEETWEGFGD